jgi:hypothetical protein
LRSIDRARNLVFESQRSYQRSIQSSAPVFGTPILLLVLFPSLLELRSLRNRMQPAPRWLTTSLFVLLNMSAVAGLDGCAGQPPSFASHAGRSYNLVVTATSGTLQHSLPLTLVAKK